MCAPQRDGANVCLLACPGAIIGGGGIMSWPPGRMEHIWRQYRVVRRRARDARPGEGGLRENAAVQGAIAKKVAQLTRGIRR